MTNKKPLKKQTPVLKEKKVLKVSSILPQLELMEEARKKAELLVNAYSKPISEMRENLQRLVNDPFQKLQEIQQEIILSGHLLPQDLIIQQLNGVIEDIDADLKWQKGKQYQLLENTIITPEIKIIERLQILQKEIDKINSNIIMELLTEDKVVTCARCGNILLKGKLLLYKGTMRCQGCNNILKFPSDTKF